MFIDFSSAFNTITPAKLHSKLSVLGIPQALCDWVLDFMLERRQVVRMGTNVSQPLTLSTGTPQGCPLSPKLFSLFTYDCTAPDTSSLIVKFADDTTAAGLISDNDETKYRDMVSGLVQWCGDNNLQLNVAKTKEMVIDFRKKKPALDPLIIDDQDVEQVEVFKFLGCHISNDMKWSIQINENIKKAQQRLYFLRRLKSFGLSVSILVNFYRASIECFSSAHFNLV